MVRFWIIAAVVVVAFVLFALVDAAMSDPKRARGVSKPIWVILIVLLPLAGAILWFTVGKARGRETVALAPDDDPTFSSVGSGVAGAPIHDMDARLRDLEAQLKSLDDETYPGERTGDDAGERTGDGAGERTSKATDEQPDEQADEKRDDDAR